MNKILKKKLKKIDKALKKNNSASGRNLLETQKLLIKLEYLINESKELFYK